MDRQKEQKGKTPEKLVQYESRADHLTRTYQAMIPNSIIYCPRCPSVALQEGSGRPTKITPRVQRRLIQEVSKDPTTTSKELQASLASVKVSVYDSTIRKRLGKNGLHGRVPRQKPLLSKKNIKARLNFARKP
ncbi:hypothetical protein NFI96_000492 [Prochilodus magdalenae]|nr:hypothetical protein NFI96_000492 [Prochilodus magdalenae]